MFLLIGEYFLETMSIDLGTPKSPNPTNLGSANICVAPEWKIWERGIVSETGE